jgi:arylsulfatase A
MRSILPLLGLLAASGCAAPPVDRSKPNIVLIVADDLGYGDIGAYGQRKVPTPNIDGLARCGMRFTQHYAASPVCAPSRAALLTGQSTRTGQIRGNLELGGYRDEEERGQMPLEPGTPTFASALSRAGYTTALVGKWGLGGPDSPGVPWRHGFDRFYGYLDQKQAHNYYPTHLWANDRRVSLANPFFIPHATFAGTSARAADYRRYLGQDYAPDFLLAEARRFIADNATRPFLLVYTPTLPHAALQVPEPDLQRFAGRWPDPPADDGDYTPSPAPRAARAAMIARLDDEVGALRQEIERRGLARRTLILFTSDNGPSREGAADIAFFDAAGGLRGEKRDLYEGGIRVPLIACWPGRVPGAATSPLVSGNWDIAETLRIAGGGAPGPLGEGRSLLPALTGRGEASTHPFLYWEFHEPPKAGQAVRFGRWKAIRFLPRGLDPRAPVELYDLAADPGETRDLARLRPDLVERARGLFAARSPSPHPGFNFDKR